jgi:5-methylcytosine-specific restriction endonuclease McrA
MSDSREAKRAYMRERYAANKERLGAEQRAYRKANKERLKDYWRAYYAANRERRIAETCAWAINNRDKKAAQSRIWSRANKEKRNIAHNRRRARIKASANTFTISDWRTLITRSKTCHWCKKPWNKSRRPTHDHVIPIAKGGPNTLENSVAACKSCNSKKRSQLINPITGQSILL